MKTVEHVAMPEVNSDSWSCLHTAVSSLSFEPSARLAISQSHGREVHAVNFGLPICSNLTFGFAAGVPDSADKSEPAAA